MWWSVCGCAAVRDTIALEERQREEEDCTMLDSMLEAQKELQVSLRGPEKYQGTLLSRALL